MVRVVLFSGGRGSGVLSKQLVKDPRIDLTLAINGYDDGASTGEVRRFLGDSLGPSDFRKNASRLALELGSCPPSLVQTLDERLPGGLSRHQAVAALRERTAGVPAVAERADTFIAELTRTGRAFDFDDCSVGNLVFAGSFLKCGRRFNSAIDDYCGLLGVRPGAIENVTDGANAHLVATTDDGEVLGSEEEIVGAAGQKRVREIFLIRAALTVDDRQTLGRATPAEIGRVFEERRATVALNPRLLGKLQGADLIIYAPGTQHSSLFPSYLTPGLSDAIAGNLGAIKLLITNIQTDAEIPGKSAVDLIDRALFYLNEKGRRARPTPSLITHYLVNDPAQVETSAPYVPLGQIEMLEDPRLVRVANYEDGVSGRHDAGRILGPFVQSLLDRGASRRVAVRLYDAGSVNKVAQTLVEMVRGGIGHLAVSVTAFHEGEPFDAAFLGSLPFAVRTITGEQAFVEAVGAGGFDYVLLFESSGMYRGEDVAVLASHLAIGRLDAVWGSRRLSVRDIAESVRFRFQKSPLAGAVSVVGSHVLSLACLLLYGRYISDTLSAVRAVRTDDLQDLGVAVTHKRINELLLARLLRRKAEILEIPVQFFPISPERVKRTTLVDGLRALVTLVAGRLTAPRPPGAATRTAAHEPADTQRGRTSPAASR
jgi:2-phospho-L-lactate transferase/gluconeogenesis factor (CofD/UPF0052 family)